MSSSENDSFATNSSLLHSECFNSITAWYFYNTFTVTAILLVVPLSILILYPGHREWRQRRSVSTVAPISHSDFFSYNMATMELIGAMGNSISLCGIHIGAWTLIYVGSLIGSFPWYGQMLFPVLICVNRYLAVVHPISYLSLKRARGVRMRNTITACVWVLCCVGVACMLLYFKDPKSVLLATIWLMALLSLIVIFCSLSVLWALVRPRPGEVGGNEARVHKSKQRAFKTILVILTVLVLRFGGYLACNAIVVSGTISYTTTCTVRFSSVWFSLPSSLLLPLLFLQKEGKLPCCRRKPGSG